MGSEAGDEGQELEVAMSCEVERDLMVWRMTIGNVAAVLEQLARMMAGGSQGCRIFGDSWSCGLGEICFDGGVY